MLVVYILLSAYLVCLSLAYKLADEMYDDID